MCTRNVKIYKRISSVSHQITKQFSQSHFRIQTRTRTLRHCEGGCPRRLTKTLQPPSQCPRGTDRTHRVPDTVPTSDWCECGRDARQGPDQTWFSSLSGSNTRWTSYTLMSKQNRAGTRPWGSITKEGLIPLHFSIHFVSHDVCRSPLWNDLLTVSLSCILSCSSLPSLSFRSLTICVWHSVKVLPDT